MHVTPFIGPPISPHWVWHRSTHLRPLAYERRGSYLWARLPSNKAVERERVREKGRKRWQSKKIAMLLPRGEEKSEGGDGFGWRSQRGRYTPSENGRSFWSGRADPADKVPESGVLYHSQKSGLREGLVSYWPHINLEMVTEHSRGEWFLFGMFKFSDQVEINQNILN